MLDRCSRRGSAELAPVSALKWSLHARTVLSFSAADSPGFFALRALGMTWVWCTFVNDDQTYRFAVGALLSFDLADIHVVAPLTHSPMPPLD